MKKYILLGIVLLVVAGVSFYGGYAYSKSKLPKGFSQANAQNFRQRTIGGPQDGVMGEITKIDEQSITVKSQNGSSKIVFFSDATKISKSADGSKSDLANGVQIIVTGQPNSDGSFTASNIRINN